jgi:beta-1,4-mannosyltransferase
LSALRIASWPHWYAPNQYLELFYHALERHDIEHVPNVPLQIDALQRARVDLLHLHWVYPYWRERAGGSLGQLLAVGRLRRLLARTRKRGIQLIWTVHNLEHHEGMQLSDRLGERLLHRSADLRIFHSQWSQTWALNRYGAVRGDSLVMPHGNYDGALPKPAARADTRRAERIADDCRLLLCFGQIRPYKGFEVAVEAMRRLPRGQYHLLIAGRAVHESAALLARAAAERNDISVVLQEISDQRLSDLLEAADAVLLPYLRVTGSGVLLTALTCSRGVIASNLPYFHEVLDVEPAAGVLVPPGDPDALAQGIRQFFERPDHHRAAAARALADRYSWHKLVEPVAQWIHAHVTTASDSNHAPGANVQAAGRDVVQTKP